MGFYSLSSLSLTLEDLPDEFVNRLPRYDAIPAALIGRLARDERVRGQGALPHASELMAYPSVSRFPGIDRNRMPPQESRGVGLARIAGRYGQHQISQ